MRTSPDVSTSLLHFPRENFSRGLFTISELPGLQKIHSGKVREIFSNADAAELVMITTDRLSAYDHVVCTIPRKGAVLNLLTQWWGQQLSDVIQNHIISVPHPNVLIAKKLDMLPVEFVVRGYLSESSSSTSLWHSYSQGEENPYGIDLPNGLVANEQLPFPVITPTTKAKEGEHDTPLTREQARRLIDDQYGKGVYDAVAEKSLSIFQKAQLILGEKGILLADTKFEFGVDKNGILTLADEILTPDNSRLWWADTYRKALDKGDNPKDFSKEPFRRWLALRGFTGDSPIPHVPTDVSNEVGEAYVALYSLVTGKRVPKQSKNQQSLIRQIQRSL